MRRSVALALSALCALVLADAAAAKTVLPGFHSPSGNIRCLFLPGAAAQAPSNLLCTIARADYAKRLQDRCMAPNGAGVDWHGFELDATRKGGVSCSGGILYSPETQRPSYVNLPYGMSWRHGMFACSSRITGVTCRNRNGHGLFISRQAWRAW